MQPNQQISALALALLLSQGALAGPVVIDGVEYTNEEQARNAIQRSIQVRIDNTPANYLKAINVSPLGYKFIVQLPTIEEARLKYVVVSGGLFKPGKATQNLIAESVMANIKFKFLAYKKIGFINNVTFESPTEIPIDRDDYDYILSFSTEFDGQRSPQAGQFRKTEWAVQKRGQSQKKPILTVNGNPAAFNDLLFFSGLQAAVDDYLKVSSQPQITPETPETGTQLPPQPKNQTSAVSPTRSVATPKDGTPNAIPRPTQELTTNLNTNATSKETALPIDKDDLVLEKALSRCLNIGFKRDSNEFRTCVTEQIRILSKD